MRNPLAQSSPCFTFNANGVTLWAMAKIPKGVREYFKKEGRRGGLKSAVARMEKLTPEQRSEYARKAAKARWAKTAAKGVVIVALLLLPLKAVAQVGPCWGQLIPQRTLGTAVCENPRPVCLTDPNGQSGRWVWQCGEDRRQVERPTIPTTSTDSSIPMRVRPPTFNDPIDTMIKLRQLRQLQLQNQQMSRQLSAPELTPAPSAPEPEKPAAALTPEAKKASQSLYACGVLDGMLTEAKVLEKPDMVRVVEEAMKGTNCEAVRRLVGF